MKTEFFTNVGTTARWVICLAALAISCIALEISVSTNHTMVHNDMILCKASKKTTGAVNEAHTSIYDLIDTGLNAALKRLGTSKELPSDKGVVAIYTDFLKGIKSTTPLDCKVLHG